jgi:orotate phosphoribosyltransferase
MPAPADPLARDRARLLELLRTLSYARKKVILSSGKESDFYIDCKATALTAEGHFLVGRLFVELIGRHAPSAVGAGGLTLGADPLASAVSLTSYLSGRPLAAFIVRKEPKGHGTGAWIEGRGQFADGDPVVVLEDVVTTGASTLKALERVRAEGLQPLAAMALVDRLDGGREAVEATGAKLYTLFTRRDFEGGAA